MYLKFGNLIINDGKVNLAIISTTNPYFSIITYNRIYRIYSSDLNTTWNELKVQLRTNQYACNFHSIGLQHGNIIFKEDQIESIEMVNGNCAIIGPHKDAICLIDGDHELYPKPLEIYTGIQKYMIMANITM